MSTQNLQELIETNPLEAAEAIWTTSIAREDRWEWSENLRDALVQLKDNAVAAERPSDLVASVRAMASVDRYQKTCCRL